jgi:predicted O-methyltransferase YrrM
MPEGAHMTAQRWERTTRYLLEVFGHEDESLVRLQQEAARRGFRAMAVSADVGRLLKILASATRGRLAIEIGTFAGYSGTWICRGLSEAGRLVTIEIDPRHADLAEQHFQRAGLAGRVEVRRGSALDVLPAMLEVLGPASVDFVFIDGEKREYPVYWRLVRPLVAQGGFVVVDNALGAGTWWIDDVGDTSREHVDQLNRAIAGDEEFEAVAVPLRQGLLVARRMNLK